MSLSYPGPHTEPMNGLLGT